MPHWLLPHPLLITTHYTCIGLPACMQGLAPSQWGFVLLFHSTMVTYYGDQFDHKANRVLLNAMSHMSVT